MLGEMRLMVVVSNISIIQMGSYKEFLDTEQTLP